MKQYDVSKNTNFIASENIENFANRLLNQYLVKRDKGFKKPFKKSFKSYL